MEETVQDVTDLSSVQVEEAEAPPSITRLGKIVEVALGYSPTTEGMFGLILKLGGRNPDNTTWAADASVVCLGLHVSPKEGDNWTEADRDTMFLDILKKTNTLLIHANKRFVSDLAGVPVEVTVTENILTSWRVLSEVI